MGQAVNLAVERFVTVGETIADDNPDIKQDMYDACKEARAAGNWISIPHALARVNNSGRNGNLNATQLNQLSGLFPYRIAEKHKVYSYT